MGSKIVVVGSLNMDMVVKIDQRPQKGETVLGSEMFMSAGGKGANQAYAAALLGGDVTMVGCLGEDVFADKLKDNLANAGVDVSHIETRKDAASGTAFISIDWEGDNSIIVAPGANNLLSVGLVQEKESLIKNAGLLIVQLETPLDAITEAVRIAKENGVPVLLDPAPAQKLPAELLAMVDYITPNETEMFILTGIEVKDTKTAQVAAAKLLEQGVKTVVAKMGGKGVTVVNPNRTSYIEGYKVDVADTTAAGDAFAGAVGACLVEGTDIWSAAHFGNAVGALTVTRLGAQASIPTRAEVEAFIKENVNA